MGKVFAAVLVWLGLAAGASAGPILSTGPYSITMPLGDHYLVFGDVFHVPNTYRYQYTVQSLNTYDSKFELGLASNEYFWGNYTESNVQVSPGPGLLLHDLTPHTTIKPYLGRHNYVFTELAGRNRVGIAIGAGETVVLSFDDAHVPGLLRWSFREIHASQVATRNSAILKVGNLPVPSAPEPSTIVLACVGAAGMGLSALRRRRQKLAPE
jgi:hypothetical protein